MKRSRELIGRICAAGLLVVALALPAQAQKASGKVVYLVAEMVGKFDPDAFRSAHDGRDIEVTVIKRDAMRTALAQAVDRSEVSKVVPVFYVAYPGEGETLYSKFLVGFMRGVRKSKLQHVEKVMEQPLCTIVEMAPNSKRETTRLYSIVTVKNPTASQDCFSKSAAFFTG